MKKLLNHWVFFFFFQAIEPPLDIHSIAFCHIYTCRDSLIALMAMPIVCDSPNKSLNFYKDNHPFNHREACVIWHGMLVVNLLCLASFMLVLFYYIFVYLFIYLYIYIYIFDYFIGCLQFKERIKKRRRTFTILVKFN